MLNLTTAVQVPNIQKIQVTSVLLDTQPESGIPTATIGLSVLGAGGVVYALVSLMLTDGVGQGLRVNPAPLGYLDRVQTFSQAYPTGFTDVVNAYTGAIAARNKAVETVLETAGLLPPGTVQ